MSTGNDCTQSSSVLTNTTFRHYTVHRWDETIMTLKLLWRQSVHFRDALIYKHPRCVLKCLFYYFTLIAIFSLTEQGHFHLHFTRLESAYSLIKKQTWQKNLHYFNHNLYLSFSRFQCWLKQPPLCVFLISHQWARVNKDRQIITLQSRTEPSGALFI